MRINHLFVIAPSLFLLVGCTGIRETEFVRGLQNVQLSSSEIRARLTMFGQQFYGGVEHAADSIIGQTSDPAIRRNALMWKAYAVPVSYETTMQREPVLGVVDLWAFSMQMSRYFDGGAGSDAFGSLQSIAVNASTQLERDAFDFMQSLTVSGQVADTAVQQFRDWAENHPIRSPLFLRESIAVEFPQAYANLGTNVTGAVGQMERTVSAIEIRLGFMNEYLLKEVGWHTELIATNLLGGESLQEALSTDALGQIGTLAAEAPELIVSERSALLDGVERERLAIIDAIDAQRGAIIDAFNVQRQAIKDGVTAERIVVLAALREEREATMAQFDTLLTQAFVDSRGLVDHFFLRVAQMLVAVGIAVVLGLLLVLRMRRGRGIAKA